MVLLEVSRFDFDISFLVTSNTKTGKFSVAYPDEGILIKKISSKRSGGMTGDFNSNESGTSIVYHGERY